MFDHRHHRVLLLDYVNCLTEKCLDEALGIPISTESLGCVSVLFSEMVRALWGKVLIKPLFGKGDGFVEV